MTMHADVDTANYVKLYKLASFYQTASLADRLTRLASRFIGRETFPVFLDLYDMVPESVKAIMHSHIQGNS